MGISLHNYMSIVMSVCMCFRAIGKFSFSFCYTLKHINMYTDMCIDTPLQSSESVLSAAGISIGVVGSLIFIALAFATGFGLGRCVHFRKKSKQTPAGTLMSHYCIYVLIIIMSVCDCSLRTYKYKYL